MKASSHTLVGVKSRYPKTTRIRTTLYDLIEAISEEIRSKEDGLIAQTVSHLVDTGKLKFIGVSKDFNAI